MGCGHYAAYGNRCITIEKGPNLYIKFDKKSMVVDIKEKYPQRIKIYSTNKKAYIIKEPFGTPEFIYPGKIELWWEDMESEIPNEFWTSDSYQRIIISVDLDTLNMIDDIIDKKSSFLGWLYRKNEEDYPGFIYTKKEFNDDDPLIIEPKLNIATKIMNSIPTGGYLCYAFGQEWEKVKDNYWSNGHHHETNNEIKTDLIRWIKYYLDITKNYKG